MHGFYIEERRLPIGVSLSKDLVQHILTRAAHGSVVVVAERPQDLAAVTKKQWNALIRLVLRERASTLNAARIKELSNQVSWMQKMRFQVMVPEALPQNCIFFATAKSLVISPPICSTLYVTSQITTEELRLATSWLPSSSVVIIYDP